MKAACPECSSTDLRISRKLPSVGHYPILARLGTFFKPPILQVVLCANCGLIRQYASPQACAKSRTAWKPFEADDSSSPAAKLQPTLKPEDW